MVPEDAQRWAELLGAVEAADRVGENFDVEDCAEELSDPDVDFAANSVIVLDGDRAVAYQVLRKRVGVARRELSSDGRVHPDHRGRGIGTALVAFGLQRADELGLALGMQVQESTASAVALAEGSGLRVVRWFSLLTRDLAEPVAAVAVPEGMQLELLGSDYDAVRWNERLREVRNAAFADHWGSTVSTSEAFAHNVVGTRGFRPGCSVAACTADGTVAGLVLSYEFAADTASTGVRDLYVGAVATLSEHRGRGLAGAMLARVLEQAVAQGYQHSSLDVDSANPTGALGIYERAGYALKSRSIVYTSEPAL